MATILQCAIARQLARDKRRINQHQHNDRDTLEHVSIPYLAQATRVNVAAIAMLATAAAD